MKIAVSRPDGSTKIHIKYPDIVVCNTQHIVGIVELKYQPRAKPSWKKDINTFAWIDQHREKISVSNVRFHGVEADANPYSLASDVLFVWAGIHTPWAHRIGDDVTPALQSSFLEMHADTHADRVPSVR